ncbi:MAG TPA: helix-turn-helix domain-containing protein [Candidatus Limnocylindria bacterium]|nr:helix-turn-helix domain-containing protein [Candidatus Limnocylindria bacterium]
MFRRLGYRQVTMKAIAHACGVSAPALYRYFPSKLDFATFPLEETPAGYCAKLLNDAVDREADPLRGLRAALESAMTDVDLVVLGVKMALEAGRDEPQVFTPARLEAYDVMVRDVLLRCLPGLRDRAGDLAHTLVALVVAAGAVDAEVSRSALWRQMMPVLRAYAVDAGAEASRFDEVFAESGPA